MGQQASNTAEVVFEDVMVPRQNLLGKEGAGFKLAMKTLDHTRHAVAAEAVGVARRALEEAVRYTKERVQFGKPIAANQAVRLDSEGRHLRQCAGLSPSIARWRLGMT